MVMQQLATPLLFERLPNDNYAPSPAFSSDEPGRILVVGADRRSHAALLAELHRLGHSAMGVPDARSTFLSIDSYAPDLIVLATSLPDSDGYATCAAIKRDPALWHLPVMLIAAADAPESRMRAIEAEADTFLCFPIDPSELAARVRMLLRAKRRIDRMELAEDVIFSLARAVEAKDTYTEGHLQRLAIYARAIGEQLALSRRDIEVLCYGALLHDVGKVGIDEGILRKGGPLSPEERAQMQMHPLIGERIVQPLRISGVVAPIVRHHHERWDGQGYPDGLAGEDIPLGARIVAVADAFDAMTTQRPYNTMLSFEDAVQRLLLDVGRAFDVQVVTAFIVWLNGSLIERAVGM